MAIGRKRKAAEQSRDDLYDSEEVQVAIASPKRTVLRNMPAGNAHNKRRRTLDHVLIQTSRETKKLLSDQQSFAVRSRRQQSTLSETPSDGFEDVTHDASSSTRRRQRPSGGHQTEQAPLASSESDEPVTSIATAHDANRERVGTRPRRSAQRRSYVETAGISNESADELATARPSRAKKRATPRRPASASFDYEDESSAAVMESEDEYKSDDPASEEDGGFDDDEPIDDDTPSSGAKRKRSSAKRNPSAAGADAAALPLRKMSKNMKNLMGSSRSLDLSLPPLHNIEDIFFDLTSRALTLGLDRAVDHLPKRTLQVATMCSGTESPLLAVEMIQDALRKSHGSTFEIEHLFSAEIVPFKQAYIERNFNPPVIFQDIKELVNAVHDDEPMATTAYGGKARVPKHIDLLIAGTSCVDYSLLNKYRKDITDGGESGDTWHAVLAFCKAFRPAIVVLENVRFAKWDDMLEYYRNAGYEPAGAIVDTKDYYIPQTRQRGYMVCFDKTRTRKAGVSSAVNDWTALMEKLQRRASSPVSSFLLPINQLASRPLQINENSRDVDWSKCEITQMNHRLERRLGVGRPITHWTESGSMCPPDHGSRAWHTAQVERVLDTLDAATLRKASEGYDARFKTRIWDVSQNIHRINDTNSFGVIGCITPTAINFVSDSWRAMTPEESLVLQGIPLNKISFTVESNAEVQDLAGNAMSAPLVGCAIISSLIAGHRVFDTRSESKPQKRQAVQDAAELVASDMQLVSDGSSDEQIDVSNLHEAAERASRRCYCEGGHGLAKHAIQQCTDCGHTTCIACGGNPVHNYRQSQELTSGRRSFAEFEDNLRSKLPLQLRLANLPKWPDHKGPANYYSILRRLTASVFSLSSIPRTHCIRVLYTAPHGYLELFLLGGKATWQLFANAPEDLASNAAMRETLSQPVARAHVGKSLLSASWEWREPQETNGSAIISGYGEHIPVWQARMQMPDFREDWQWQFLKVNSANCPDHVDGTYKLLPHCGTANESLYVRIDLEERSPVYIFLDPTRVGPLDGDCFVFARDHFLLEYGESRQTLARISSTWRPWKCQGSDSNNPTSTSIKYYKWRSHGESPAVMPVNTDIILRKPADLALVSQDLSCRQASIAMSAEIDLPSIAQLAPTQNGFVRLDDQNFFSTKAFVFEAMRRRLPTNTWVDMPEPAPALCEDCAPETPSLRWKRKEDGSIIPYEDPHNAAIYERAAKSLPSPLLVKVEQNSLHLGINFVSLAHRARSRLPSTSSEVTYRWRLVTKRSGNSALKRFHLKPTRDIQPHDDDLHMSVNLFPKQRLALAWMQEQESGLGKQVTLEEAEEAGLLHLGWRVEMRAETTQYVKGGICADHPGFGKTITSLALVQAEWLKHGDKALRESLRRLQDMNSGSGFLASSATVIVCPKLLVDQWYAEACQKWKSKETICLIKEAGDVSKHTIKDFEFAKLIIVSKEALATGTYTERLAAFAGLPGPHTDRGRAYAAWLKYAIKEIPEHLQILDQSGKSELEKHLKAKHRDFLSSKELDGYVPSKRLRGQAYAEAQSEKTSKTSSKPKALKSSVPQLRTDSVGQPFFEMFFFNRIVVDEFHKCDAKEFEVITALNAAKRWGLSGTPALFDCYDVAQIGRLLHVPLRMGSIQKGFMRQYNIKKLHAQMTNFEKFEAARKTPSESQNGRIQELAQGFLDVFARRNLMDFDELSVQQHLVPVNLTLGHHATYHELSQHLDSSDMKIRKSGKKEKTDQQKHLADAVQSSDSAEEALSKSAVCPRVVDPVNPSKSTLEDWIAKREGEIEKWRSELGPMLQKACAKEPEAYYAWKKARIDSGDLKDKETLAIVKGLCTKVDGGKASGSVEVPSKATSSAEGAREFSSHANKLVTRLLTSRRSTRYLQNVKKLQDLALRKKGCPRKCDDPDCESELSANDHVAVSGLCGHLVCKDCFDRSRAKNVEKCLTEGCHESMMAHHLLWNCTIGDIRSKKHSQHGAKIEAALNVLDDIRQMGEQAVLFVQFDNQLAPMEHALQERDIPAVVIQMDDDGVKKKATSNAAKKRNADAAKKIAEFQRNKDNTVIVLNASSEAAAGLNLQNANHVIFLSPLLRDTQYAYDSTMAQAIGRVRRHGQKKEIHVYRIVALNTIDVDILEHRERRTDVLTEQGASRIQPPAAAKMLDMHASQPHAERTQLVKEDGKFSLRPQSWLVKCGADEEAREYGVGGDEVWRRVKRRKRVGGWEDFSSLVKFSRTFAEDDE